MYLLYSFILMSAKTMMQSLKTFTEMTRRLTHKSVISGTELSTSPDTTQANKLNNCRLWKGGCHIFWWWQLVSDLWWHANSSACSARRASLHFQFSEFICTEITATVAHRLARPRRSATSVSTTVCMVSGGWSILAGRRRDTRIKISRHSTV